MGDWMRAFASELFPICRSITGEGLRATLRRIQQEIPIAIHEVPSGAQVLDWVIPDEWNIRDAWIKNARGERVVDFRKHNLHVVNYSMPVRARKALTKLMPHLHTLPEHPDWIPYRTSYYKRQWGFCLEHRRLAAMSDGEYEVCIDSTLAPGSLSYGELLIPGESEDEFLISTHCCHPSLANDNLSGIAVAVALAKQLNGRARRSARAGDTATRSGVRGATRPACSVRFLFIPGTIGAITWLARNEERLERIKHGLVLTCLGDSGPFTYKRSRRGDAPIDFVVEQVLRKSGAPHRIIDFAPTGYDERQYCSPGFNLPVGCLMRSQHGVFPEYHTSADNLDFIKAESLAESLGHLLAVIEQNENEPADPARTTIQDSRFTTHGSRFINLKPKGEPQLGKYGLYEALDNDMSPALWVLNFSDGGHSLADIAARSGLPFDKVARAADILCNHGLLKEAGP
jgi:aminopeptidase-like protein